MSGDINQGIDLKIVMNRRIINEILTTYLPTVFILGIVYATNFFKPFFFEAVVTVNLTSLLVLTTLFISVSKSLPPTAYVKMIDIWLIFSQLIPFAEVIYLFDLFIMSYTPALATSQPQCEFPETIPTPQLLFTQQMKDLYVPENIICELLHSGHNFRGIRKYWKME